ncbi:MAG: hypothetical protein OSJ73_00575 [Lachnospiraceae bacterium]|nr:hypothetical protein [Lachnospiraceae bacterium]
MKTEVLFNDGWEFIKQKLETSLEEVCAKKDCFVSVGLPHDWLIEQVNDLYESSADGIESAFCGIKLTKKWSVCALTAFIWIVKCT